MNKPDLGILLDQHKVVQFFADKVVLYLSYIITTFIIVDSFISLIPSGRGTVACFIDSKDVNSGQQSYVNEYCAQFVLKKAYAVPIAIFCQGLITALLHYAWYAMVQFTDKVQSRKLNAPAVGEACEELMNASAELWSASTQLDKVSNENLKLKLANASLSRTLRDGSVALANAGRQPVNASHTELVKAREQLAKVGKQLATAGIQLANASTQLANVRTLLGTQSDSGILEKVELKLADASTQLANAGTQLANVANLSIRSKIQQASTKLATAGKKLSTAGTKLSTAIEKLVTAGKQLGCVTLNAMLKSALEDLESVKEELASASPDLQNVKEKLASTSPHLESVKAKLMSLCKSEIESKPTELETAVSDLENAITQLKQAIKDLDSARTELESRTTCNKDCCKSCDHCLLIFYLIKIILQLCLALIALSFAVDYEFGGRIDFLSTINKTFHCSIKNSDIDYWPQLDTVQCFYNTIAFNDIFVILYIAILVCLICALLFGCFGTDTEIVNYTLDKKPPNNDTVITMS